MQGQEENTADRRGFDMNKWKRWAFWKALRDWCNRRMKDAWMHGGNCDSCCPRCKQWESHGNKITTEPFPKWDHRVCGNCGYKWPAEFGPAGFMPLLPEDRGESLPPKEPQG